MAKKLIAKIFINGLIKAETGLHIGGSKASLDIGGVDLNVIKTPHGVPFIPGSSLKGKLRSLLARTEGSVSVRKDKSVKDGEMTDEDFKYLLQLFGSSGDDRKREEQDKGEVTRLLVRDASLNIKDFDSNFKEKEADLDFTYSYVKWENTIDRRRGTAEHPRQLERVPAGATFHFELVYDLYDDTTASYENEELTVLEKHLWAIKTAMLLLQDDYLGGHGSRGYGKVSFHDITVTEKTIQPNGAYAAGKLSEKITEFANELNNAIWKPLS